MGLLRYLKGLMHFKFTMCLSALLDQGFGQCLALCRKLYQPLNKTLQDTICFHTAKVRCSLLLFILSMKVCCSLLADFLKKLKCNKWHKWFQKVEILGLYRTVIKCYTDRIWSHRNSFACCLFGLRVSIWGINGFLQLGGEWIIGVTYIL